MSVVKVESVIKNYLLGKVVVPALKGVSIAVEKGEFLAIAGPSGSGKTTLLNLIGCIEKPTAGKILIDSVDISGRSSNELAEIRARKIGFIFQNFNLLPVLTALENIEYPLFTQEISSEKRKEKAIAALEKVGLLQFKEHKPMELSGGQRQRVAIARAMVVEPAIILADEPTANLDHKTGEEILSLMKEINQERGTTFIFATHDQKIMEMAGHLIKLWDGEVV
jgi:putative ABC transport system ATP-binding protein